jgi:hypothetical protein
MEAREILLAKRRALLAEYERNKVKLTYLKPESNLSAEDYSLELEPITVLSELNGFKWSPDGSRLLATVRGALHLIDLKPDGLRLLRIQINELLYSKFLSNQLLVCITDASLVLFSSDGHQIATVPCLHFDRDTSVFGAYLLSDSSVIIVTSCEGSPECTSLLFKNNDGIWSLDTTNNFTADHVFESNPFYANRKHDSWTVYSCMATTSTVPWTFIMAGSCPVHFKSTASDSFLLAISRDELVLVSPKQVVRRVPIECGWYSWTRSHQYLFVLYPQHVSVVELATMSIIATVLPHMLTGLNSAFKISVPADNPRLLLIYNNVTEYFYRLNF